MLYELESAAMVYECISSNARLAMVSLRESAVYDHKFTVCLDRIFTACDMYWYVSVDYVAVRAGQSEGIHDAIDNVLVVTQFEIVAFFFFVCFLISNEISLESCHFRLVEER